jgi:hypothetical protein
MTVPSRGRLAAVLAAGMGAGVRRFDGRRGDFEIVAMWKGEELRFECHHWAAVVMRTMICWLAQQRIKGVDLLLAKMASDSTLDRDRIDGPPAPPGSLASWSNYKDLSTAVLLAGASLDVTRPFDPIDKTREVVLCKRHFPRKFERSQAAGAGALQLEQRVIPSERRQSRGLERGLDGTKSHALRPSSDAPTPDHGPARFGVHGLLRQLHQA